MATSSEILFEDFCAARNYAISRIEVLPNDGRFPDYEVETPRGATVCEVKQINPNEQDKAFQESLAKYGKAGDRRSIGKRARSSLVESSEQLKRFRNDSRPCVAVMFDATRGGDYLSPPDLDAAMFGQPIVLFREGAPHPSDNRSDFTHGGNRKLTEERRLYVSAVAVLFAPSPTGPIRLEIYHNPFTDNPLWPSYFPHPDDRHFLKDGHPDQTGHGWREYVGPRTDA